MPVIETNILIVRHPETEANVTTRFVGRGDSPYTAEGCAQAARLPVEIQAFAPDRIWSSPLRRAFEVASAAAETTGVELVVDERLVELDFGLAEGMTWEEITEAGLKFDYRALETPVAPDGESRGDIERRSAAVAHAILEIGGNHVVVTHGGVMRAMLVHLLGLTDRAIWTFHLHNAQLAHVRVVDGHGMLEEFRQG